MQPSEQSRDEAGELRAALVVGTWRRLTDPLVPLLVLSDPGEWWREASRECSWQLRVEVDPTRGIISPRGWTVVDLQRAMVASTRELLTSIGPPSELRAVALSALDILEQFAPP